MVTLENWRERMSEDMRLRDFRPRTQEAYALDDAATTRRRDTTACPLTPNRVVRAP